jgi:hypothetical protein
MAGDPMSFFSADHKRLVQAILETTSCPFCGAAPKLVRTRRTRFDVDCHRGHAFSLTSPQVRHARPSFEP